MFKSKITLNGEIIRCPLHCTCDSGVLYKYTSAGVYFLTLHLLPKFMFDSDPSLNYAENLHLVHLLWGDAVSNFTSVTILKLTKCAVKYI